MVTSVSIKNEWVEIAQLFGDVENVVKEALQAYFLEQCRQRVNQATAKIADFRKKYACEYDAFKHAIQTDEDFLKKVETQNKFWEEDAMEWEYWLEEQKTWQHRLLAILQS